MNVNYRVSDIQALQFNNPLKLPTVGMLSRKPDVAYNAVSRAKLCGFWVDLTE